MKEQKLQRNIIIGLTILMILAIGIKTYQNNKEKENFLNNTTTNEIIKKYENPKLQSLYEELDEYLKNKGIQVFELEVKEDKNGTIGYFFQYDLINENRINEIEPQLKEILKKYQNHEKIYEKQNNEIIKPQAKEIPYKPLVINEEKKYSNYNETKKEENGYSNKTRNYWISRTYDGNYILNTYWENKTIEIKMNENEYLNIENDIKNKRYLIVNNCYKTDPYNNKHYYKCIYNFVD